MNQPLNLNLFVRAGQIIRAPIWNAMATAVRALTLLKGPGVGLLSTPGGTIISFDPPENVFLHAFKVALIGQKGATIRPGNVNGIPCKIDDAPLDPVKDGDQPPTLQWTTPHLTDDGYGWIAVESTLGDQWEVKSNQIVQVADLDTDDGLPADTPADGSQPAGYSAGGTLTLSGRRARQPLAMLRQRKSGQLALFQVTKFDLKHRVALASAFAEKGRHFFSAAT